MTELATSMSSGISEDKTPLGIGQSQIIWPTVEDVRCSLEVVNKLVFSVGLFHHKYFFFLLCKVIVINPLEEAKSKVFMLAKLCFY